MGLSALTSGIGLCGRALGVGLHGGGSFHERGGSNQYITLKKQTNNNRQSEKKYIKHRDENKQMKTY